MTQPHGGYRRPTNPAPVSGPGRLSRRTDGGPGQPVRQLPNPDYGEQQVFKQAQQGAPMAAAPDAGGGAIPVQPADLSQVVPMDAPTSRPGEPVTTGAGAGPGGGQEVLGIGGSNDPGIQYLRKNLPTFELMANMPMASDAFRQWVRRIRAAM
jgi:hypothetical protein